MLVPLLGGGTNLFIVLERLEIFRKIPGSPQVDREHAILGSSSSRGLRLTAPAGPGVVWADGDPLLSTASPAHLLPSHLDGLAGRTVRLPSAGPWCSVKKGDVR